MPKSKLKVLVVDDDEDIRILVTKWLEDTYEVDTAVDGTDCLKKIGKKKYDLILLDVMMPGPTGGKLINKIMKKDPEARIVYLTAVEMFKPTPEQERKGQVPVLEEAVKGYLLKPVTKEQVIDKIKKVLKLEKLLK